MTTHRIILASGSPRRKELLGSLGVDFTVIKPDVDEKSFDLAHCTPAEKVCFLADVKAKAVFEKHSGNIVIGADTLVALNNAIFEKPDDEADALRMLKALQGTTHTVYSAIAVYHPDGRHVCDYLATDVTFIPMSDEHIRRYIATGEPMDKAGAYAIQGHGSVQIEKINGCYFNVVGMSLYLLDQLFARLGESLLSAKTPAFSDYPY